MYAKSVWKRNRSFFFTDPGAYITSAVQENKSKVHSRSGREGSEGQYATVSFISALGRYERVPILQETGWTQGCGKSNPPPGLNPRTVQPVASRY